MPKQLLEFKQSKYLPGRGGVCFSLCARWARSMLEAEKNGWGSPKASAEERSRPFLVPAAKSDIARTHAVFSAKQNRHRANAEAFDTAISVVRVLNANGYRPTGQAIVDAVAPAILSAEASIADNLKGTIEHFGVRVTSRIEAAWGNIASSIDTHQTAVASFTTATSHGHAISIYRTTGVFSTDYYVFEPNFGEYLCSGEADMDDLLGRIQKVAGYNSPQTATLYFVTL